MKRHRNYKQITLNHLKIKYDNYELVKVIRKHSDCK